MSLKDRIKIINNGFRVYPENGADRTGYYNTFILADETVQNVKENQINYFSPMAKAAEMCNTVDKGSFISVHEYEGDRLVEEYHFYFQGEAAMQSLTWSIEPAPKYEVLKPYKITITWNGRAEKLHSNHVKLYCKRNNFSYDFLADYIIPCDAKAEFIISLPEKVNVSDLEVVFDKLVEMKYSIRRE